MLSQLRAAPHPRPELVEGRAPSPRSFDKLRTGRRKAILRHHAALTRRPIRPISVHDTAGAARGPAHSVAHPVCREHLVPHLVSADQHRPRLDAAVLQAALQCQPRRRLDARLFHLGESVRADLRAGRRLRRHHELPVRHQLAGLHAEGRQHRRAAARLRDPHRLLPRGRVPRHHAVRLPPRLQPRPHARHLPRRLRHVGLGLLDPGAELLDADAGRLRDARRRRPCRVVVGGDLQSVLPLSPGAHAARLGADGRRS